MFIRGKRGQGCYILLMRFSRCNERRMGRSSRSNHMAAFLDKISASSTHHLSLPTKKKKRKTYNIPPFIHMGRHVYNALLFLVLLCLLICCWKLEVFVTLDVCPKSAAEVEMRWMRWLCINQPSSFLFVVCVWHESTHLTLIENETHSCALGVALLWGLQ